MASRQAGAGVIHPEGGCRGPGVPGAGPCAGAEAPPLSPVRARGTCRRRDVLSRLVGAAGALALMPRRLAADPPFVKSPHAPPDVLTFADACRGKPFTKDPSVIRFHGAYLLYYSLPPGAGHAGWSAGIARSRDLVSWEKAGEVLPAGGCEAKGLAAPDAMVFRGQVHLFYQTYGNGKADAICHAVSEDGIRFERDPSNPIFRPSGAWTCGRAIDAETVHWKGRVLLYWATRDPGMKIQMLGVAGAPEDSDLGRGAWTQLCGGPILKPELPWERACIEAASVCEHDGRLFLFYAGGYNNDPQQIGVAVSDDGIAWTRLSDEPFLANGREGEWNASESGHPGVFVDDDQSTHLFFQGNNDRGKTWYLSKAKVAWDAKGPRLAP